VVDSAERERTTSELGELIMTRLKDIDTVAYIRLPACIATQRCEGVQGGAEELLSGRDAKKKKASF